MWGKSREVYGSVFVFISGGRDRGAGCVRVEPLDLHVNVMFDDY